MPEPLPISSSELKQLLANPPELVRRMILSFVLERPRRVVAQPARKPDPRDGSPGPTKAG